MERCGIHEVSLYVHHDGHADKESALSDYDAYYRRLADLSALPTTSQPSIGDFLEVYEPLLVAGNEIVSIHLSGGISGHTAPLRRPVRRSARSWRRACM